MTTNITIKQQIHRMIDALPPEQLAALYQFLQAFFKTDKAPESQIAPIYQIHQQAIDTDIDDLAEQHDHYLYGVDKHNA